MDAENLAAVQRLLPVTGTRHLHRLLDFAPAGFPRDVPDPYFDGNFDAVYDLVDAGCRGLLAHLWAEHAL